VAPERVVAFGPGRVNLIGEHTDYNAGLSLPFAIEAGVTVVATSHEGDDIEVHALDAGEDDRFRLSDPPPAQGWRAFVRGTVAELRAAGIPVPPSRVEFSGTVPQGSGLSSSAALEAALCLAMAALAGVDDPDRMQLARLSSRVENEWVGARTGLLDQIAALLGSEGHGLRVDFRSMDVEPVPLQTGDWRIVVLDSGASHSHAESGYNERRRECEEACRVLGVASLREATPDAAASLPEPLRARARHVVEENERVEAAVAALRDGDLPAVGALLDASHASLRDLYEVSTPGVERTVQALRDAGAAGARIVGGGFGGHVLALLPPGAVPPDGALDVRPAAGARVLEVG
jgi:galactokinase